MSKRKALGRGLGALMPAVDANEGANAGMRQVAVNSIHPNPQQPRTNFDEDALQELADSIAQHGLIQPLVVTEDKPGHYTLIAGERRWRASQIAGMSEIPVVIKDASPQERVEWALIENIQRADLNPIEEAMAYQHLVDEFNLTHAALAERVGKSRSEVSNRIGLLKLPADVQQAVTDKHLSYGHARVLSGLPTPEAQRSLMKQIISRDLSVRRAEAIARKLKEGEKVIPKLQRQPSPEIIDLEMKFRNRLGTKVSVYQDANGKGKVVINFYNDEDLHAIYNAIIDSDGS